MGLPPARKVPATRVVKNVTMNRTTWIANDFLSFRGSSDYKIKEMEAGFRK